MPLLEARQAPQMDMLACRPRWEGQETAGGSPGDQLLGNVAEAHHQHGLAVQGLADGPAQAALLHGLLHAPGIAQACQRQEDGHLSTGQRIACCLAGDIAHPDAQFRCLQGEQALWIAHPLWQDVGLCSALVGRQMMTFLPGNSTHR